MSSTTVRRDPTGLDQAAVQSYFDVTSQRWKDVYETHGVQPAIYQARMAAVLGFFDQVAPPPGARVLDIGCGAGVGTVEIARREYGVRAIDTAEAMLDLTRQRAARAGVEDRVSTETGDIHALEFPDNAFDVVVAIGVVPWVPFLAKPLAEIARVLKTRGHLILTADNRLRLSRLVDPLLPVRRMTAGLLRALRLRAPLFASRMHSTAEIDAALACAGFHKERGVTLGFGPFTLGGFYVVPDGVGLRLQRALQRNAERGGVMKNAGAQYVVLARKEG